MDFQYLRTTGGMHSPQNEELIMFRSQSGEIGLAIGGIANFHDTGFIQDPLCGPEMHNFRGMFVKGREIVKFFLACKPLLPADRGVENWVFDNVLTTCLVSNTWSIGIMSKNLAVDIIMSSCQVLYACKWFKKKSRIQLTA